jgi:biofilm protein TabA
MIQCRELEKGGGYIMAVVGYLHEVMRNHVFPEKISTGLKYLANLEGGAFSGISAGEVRRVDLEGEALFALHQVYQTKPHDQARFEAHRRYIDIQYIYEGHETLKLASFDDASPLTEYDMEKDFSLYRVNDCSSISLKQGMVCILYPTDLHAPCLDYQGRNLIKKTVVKVLINP